MSFWQSKDFWEDKFLSAEKISDKGNFHCQKLILLKIVLVSKAKWVHCFLYSVFYIVLNIYYLFLYCWEFFWGEAWYRNLKINKILLDSNPVAVWSWHSVYAKIYPKQFSSAFFITVGVVSECQQERSQIRNKERAMQVLRARLYSIKLEEESRKREAARKIQVIFTLTSSNFSGGMVKRRDIMISVQKNGWDARQRYRVKIQNVSWE